ncbi:MAG: RcnB family protein [Sphingomonas sp.]|uniref:RcnB family protein n=1 Tax=Sphingomonas sp. TaxID=28214 RepID=UPI0025E8717B|nr:RcnB family protein [Sphingomonas sp.]MBX3564817.1 RcnB family protein [Sphingomonas sp.]
MKKFLMAAVAASLVATPALAAPQNWGQRHQPVKVVKKTVYKPAPVQYRSWQRGQRFDSRYARNYRQIDYRQYRGLKAPPRGYRYVQSGNDAVLVGVTSGIIAAIFANILR